MQYHLFDELDAAYEKVYKTVNNVSEMPSDYVSSRARLQGIVDGTDWDDLNDLSVFTKFVANKIVYVLANADAAGERSLGRTWKDRAVLDLFLEWEPTFTTIMNAMGVDLLGDNGELKIAQYETQLAQLHDMISVPSSW